MTKDFGVWISSHCLPKPANVAAAFAATFAAAAVHGASSDPFSACYNSEWWPADEREAGPAVFDGLPEGELFSAKAAYCFVQRARKARSCGCSSASTLTTLSGRCLGCASSSRSPSLLRSTSSAAASGINRTSRGGSHLQSRLASCRPTRGRCWPGVSQYNVPTLYNYGNVSCLSILPRTTRRTQLESTRLAGGVRL